MIAVLETERLLMRPFVAGDFSALDALHSDVSFWWFPLRRAMTSDETAAFLDRIMRGYDAPTDPSVEAVIDRDSGDLVGWGGLSVPRFLPEILPAVEVGWRLGTPFRGRGYATEIGRVALEWGFTALALDRIVSIFEPENVASGRVMDRLGFAAGYATVDPVRNLPLIVRELTRASWSALR